MSKPGKNRYRCVSRCHTLVFTALLPSISSRVQCAASASHHGEIQRWRARQRLGILGSRTVGKQRQAQTGFGFA